jgi:hypothetical protein
MDFLGEPEASAIQSYVDKLESENMRLKEGITDALMHLKTNYCIDGNSMNDSDAADALRLALSNS